MPITAFAQSAPVVSRPVVQAVPSAHSQTLSQALARIGRDPRDVAALIDAGDAARELGDYDAAIGFYRRADVISAGNARIKAGLAGALVFSGDPVAALPVFAEAERVGALPRAIAADRGLAYDLVGDNTAAQRSYRTALGGAGDDELRMRLAISQAIGGDADAADVTLMPLLRKQDKAGWRTRAFTYAIAGKTKEAVDLANSILPPRLAQDVAPYLRYMPRLTRAQQAAAANLGAFPRASEIGRDEPRIAAYRSVQVASADAALIPRGAQLGSATGKEAKASKAESRSKAAARQQAEENRRQAELAENRRKAALAAAQADRVAPPEPKPTIELPPVAVNGELPPVNASPFPRPSTPPPAPAVAPRPAPTVTASTQDKPAGPVPAPGFDLARIGSVPSNSPPTPDVPPQAPPEPGPKQLSLSEIFADLGAPTAQDAPAPGAVDIRRIAAAKPKPKPKEEAKPAEKPKKPAPPAHPSRIWVQIGVGSNKDAIAFDWRRYIRQAPELFKGRKAYVSDMGRTNRILAGPFETTKAANQFVTDLRKAGIGGAVPWTSPAGQVVDQLPTK